LDHQWLWVYCLASKSATILNLVLSVSLLELYLI
jgi:hypothetical protein